MTRSIVRSRRARTGLPLRMVALLSAAALAVAFLACGGGDSSDASAPARAPSIGQSTTDMAVEASSLGGFPSGEIETFAGDDGLFDAAVDSPLPFGGDDGGGVSAATLLDRQIIRNGSIDIEVESVVEAFEEITATVVAAGGFVSASTFFGREEEQSAQMTVRIPVEQFDMVLGRLRTLAVEVLSISTSAQDVTGEVTDLESEQRNLRAVELQYLELLGRADSIGDILQVQDRLNGVRMQIDRTEGRLQMLDRLSDLATLTVQLHPVSELEVEAPSEGLLDAAQDAWEASLATLSTIATVAIVVVVYSWWLVPVLVIVALVARRIRAAWPAGRGNADAGDTAGDTADGTP